MRFIWTTSKLPASHMIRWGLKEPVSHFAICFDDRLVFQSNFLGLNMMWANEFFRCSKAHYEIEFDLSLEEEEEVYQSVVQNFGFEGYDWGAFFYFFYRAFRWRVLGHPFPKESAWQDPKKYLCTEIYNKLPEWIAPNDLVKDWSITTPMTMYNVLAKHHHGNPKVKRIGEVQ